MSLIIRSRPAPKILHLQLNNPPLNPLISELVGQLAQQLSASLSDPEIQIILLSGASNSFAAGADIRRLERLAKKAAQKNTERSQLNTDDAEEGPRSQASLPELIQAVEQSPKPVIALIDGFALGGGLELALACHLRIATPEAKLGLPELSLGLIPGAGGTVRLPRLIGAASAIDIILSSKQVSAEQSFELGLVDQIAAREQLINAGVEQAKALLAQLAQGATLRRTSALPIREAEAELQVLIAEAERRYTKLFENVGFPAHCLASIHYACLNSAEAALAEERRYFARCLSEPAAQGLIHLFFSQRNMSKVPEGLLESTSETPSSQSPITNKPGAAPHAEAELSVSYILEPPVQASRTTEALIQGLSRAGAKATWALGPSSPSTEPAASLMQNAESGRIGIYPSFKAAQRSSDTEANGAPALLIDLSHEPPATRAALYDKYLGLQPRGMILCDAQALSPLVEALPSAKRRRVLGFIPHLRAQLKAGAAGQPAKQIDTFPLCELIFTRHTDPLVLSSAVSLVKRLRSTPLLCQGQAVCGELFKISREICEQLNAAGHTNMAIQTAFERFGFKLSPEINQELFGPIEASKAKEEPRLRLSPEEIPQLLSFAWWNHAKRCLADGQLLRSADLDVAWQAIAGFPGYRGGPVHYTEALGSEYIAAKLSAWYEITGHPSLKPSRSPEVGAAR